MLRIPFPILNNCVYDVLTTYQTTSVFLTTPTVPVFPYIKIGKFSCVDNGAKKTDIVDAQLEISIFSNTSTPQEINQIANEVLTVLNNVAINLTVDNFAVLSQNITHFHTENDFPDCANAGTFNLNVKIQNLI